jgi:hypothetical protein
MLIIFFDIKGIFHKEFALAGQTVNYYYCDVLRLLLENVRRLRPELWQQKNWLLHYDNALSNTSFSTREFLTKNNTTVVPHLLYFSVFPTKIKLRGRHVDTIEVIETESQAVLNTHRRRLPGCIKNGRSAGKDAYVRKMTTLSVMVSSRQGASFFADGSKKSRDGSVNMATAYGLEEPGSIPG